VTPERLIFLSCRTLSLDAHTTRSRRRAHEALRRSHHPRQPTPRFASPRRGVCPGARTLEKLSLFYTHGIHNEEAHPPGCRASLRLGDCYANAACARKYLYLPSHCEKEQGTERGPRPPEALERAAPCDFHFVSFHFIKYARERT
jgi:hypothetical protein